MSSSHYSKSVHSVRSLRDSETESWGTVHSGSRTSTPAPYPGYLPTYSHRSNPSYPSSQYGPSAPFSPSYPQTPGTPYLSPVPLPQYYNGPTPPSAPHLSTVPLPANVTVNPLLQCPPKAVFNVTYGCNSIAFRDGASSADVAVYPPVHSLVLGLSCICPGKRIDVKASFPSGVTAHDVFAALSSFLLSSITAYELSSLPPAVVSQGRAVQSRQRRTDVQSGLRWVDLLGPHVYFGGLCATFNGTYEVTFTPAPMT